MNRRILILCEAIAPPAYSPRVLTLVEYLQQQGWHCEIVTEMDNDQPLDWDICPIHSMPTYRHLVADKLFGAKEKALVRFACDQVDVDGGLEWRFCFHRKTEIGGWTHDYLAISKHKLSPGGAKQLERPYVPEQLYIEYFKWYFSSWITAKKIIKIF